MKENEFFELKRVFINGLDESPVLETVLKGNTTLFKVKSEMDMLYAKEEFSDSDGDRVGELQIIFEEMKHAVGSLLP